MKTGFLGGTFDPIHYGHLILGETAFDAFGLDRVLVIPTGHSYFKDHREEKVTPPEIRLAMTKAACADNPHFEVSDIEVRRPGNSYTFETLEELHQICPEDTFYYIIGADALCMLHKWREPGRLLSQCHVLAAVREDQVSGEELDRAIDFLEREYGAKISKMPVRNIEISSTEIRERIREGRSVRYLVPEAVTEFIIEHGLYLQH